MDARGKEIRQQNHVRRPGRHAQGSTVRNRRLREFQIRDLHDGIMTTIPQSLREIDEVRVRLRSSAAVGDQ